MINLILVDPNPSLCDAWRKHFDGIKDIEIFNGKFEDISSDCLVSPANSFGLMDGGVDLHIARFFGEKLVKDVQSYIMRNFLGEQPVGTSFIQPTMNKQHWHLAHTPTMRTPMSIAGTDAVYRAMWAMLLAVHEHNDTAKICTHLGIRKIETVACPGLGTATGQVPPQEAARQMAAAYRHFLKPLPVAMSWDFAISRQNSIAGIKHD